jgi:acetoin utilization deacetylase AcuC-like enzyme
VKICIIKDDIFLLHNPGVFHPESPERLEVLYGMLETEEMRELYAARTSRKAERGDITLNHSEAYFDRVAATAGLAQSFLDADTVTSEYSFDASLKAAGAVLLGIDLIMGGEYRTAFTLVRPPGHHAERARGMGFCLFNNVAIGARYAVKTYGLERILIIDWDLHHGNGTQASFYEEKSVLYFSTHQYPYYPGTGSLSEIGSGEGAGYTVNIPMSTGMEDVDYLRVFKLLLEPIADAYQPQLVLVSAGFDIHFNDPLGGMRVTPGGFAGMTKVVQQLADRHAGGRMLFTLEGGYNLEGLRDGVRAVIEQAAGARHSRTETFDIGGQNRGVDAVIHASKELLKGHWSFE